VRGHFSPRGQGEGFDVVVVVVVVVEFVVEEALL
jgi:hypothetical protein